MTNLVKNVASHITEQVVSSSSSSETLHEPNKHSPRLRSGSLSLSAHGGVQPSGRNASDTQQHVQQSVDRGDKLASDTAKSREERRASTIQRLEIENERLRREGDTLRQQLEDTQHHAARYKSEREAGRAEIDFLRKELSTAAGREKAITDENQQLKDLLDIRRQELKDAQRFMGTVDVSAESDVVEAVHGLNTEIFDLARSLAERATPTEHDQNARRSAETALAGEGLLDPFFSLFRSAEARDEATLEIAMQLVTTRYLAKFISTWTGYAETDTAFTTLYERIQRSEKQSVAGQWRALTRRFAAGEASSAQMGAHCESVLPVLLRHAATLSGMRPTANCKLEPLIHIMVSKALKIRRLIGEAMISSNYEVVVPLPETLFNAREMEDVYAPRGNKGRRSGLHVTCCVALGLRRVEKVEGQLRSEMLVKSEVGLQTLLADLGLETASTWSGAPAVR